MFGAGQNSAGYSSFSEVSGQGKGHHINGNMTNVKPPQREKGYEAQKPKQPAPIPNVPVSKWFRTSGEAKHGFLDIDGDSFPQVEKEDKTAKEPPKTCHKVRSYLSLMDLTRPYGRREPPNPQGIENSGKSVQATAFAKPELQHTKDNKVSNNMPTHNWDNAIKIGDPGAIRNVRLPRGFGKSDMSYVTPKFMPTFREMASEKSNRENVVEPVSIMEPTPPSMQKWAVEWNKEPTSFSIEELKEDLRREGFRAGKKQPEPLPAQDSSHSARPTQERQCHEPKTAVKSTPSSTKKSSPASTKTTLEHQKTTEEVTKNQPKPEKSNHRHNFLEMISKIPDTAGYQQTQWRPGHSPVSWIPDRFAERKQKPAFVSRKEKYSFRETIQQNDKLNQLGHSEEHDQYPSVVEGVELVSDSDKVKFHEWFKGRLSTTSTKLLDHGSSSARSTSSGNEAKSRDLADPEIHEVDPPKVDHNYGTSHSGGDEERTSYHQTEEDSSFYNWLKRRGHQLKEDARDLAAKKVEEAAEAKIPTAKFPWSRSYLSRYVPARALYRTVKSKEGPRQSRESLKSEEAWSKRLNTNLRANKVVKPKSRKAVPSTVDSRDRKHVEWASHVPPFPMGDIDNEADHVNKMRLEEKPRGKSISMKKLFPAVQNLAPKWVWEPAFGGSRTIRGQPQCDAPANRACSSSLVEGKPSKAGTKVVNSENSWAFSHSSNTGGGKFQDIAEDSQYSVKLPHDQNSTIGPDSAVVGLKSGRSPRKETEPAERDENVHDSSIECQSPKVGTHPMEDKDTPSDSLGTITLTRKPEPTLTLKTPTGGSHLRLKSSSQDQIVRYGNVFGTFPNGESSLARTKEEDQPSVQEFDNQSVDADQEWSTFVGHDRRDVFHADSDLMQVFGRTSPPISQIIHQVNVLPGC